MARFLDLDALFKGRHFDREMIILCVRWYLRSKLTFRDLVEMMEERGLSMAQPPSFAGCTTIRRNSSAGGTASRSRAERRGVWTRPT
ncbi:IS6 family transposase [Acidiphilium sp. PM]|uniref:IS6 family transposase n=1 Tax=Acidiphilium sp. PM TaxID=1043206 RepID=UPI0019D6EC84|nr:IS6 family transposase [Acidiphilium sp. PM]